MVRAMVQLAESVGMVPLAEGIETEEQAEQLRAMGCDYGQGYFYARPMAAEKVPALLSHPRWSGQSAWIPFGELDVGIGPENATSYPAAGELLLYPGGVSETELLFPYGHTSFASKAGQLAGNHFATVVDGGERLQELGELVLWHGAQDISFREL